MKGLIAAAAICLAGLASAQQRSDLLQLGSSSKDQNLYQQSRAFEMQGTVFKKSGNTVSISRQNLPAAELKIKDQTEVTLNGQKVSAAVLSEGTPVRARFQLDGDEAVAVSIEALPSGLQLQPQPGPQP